MPTGPTMAVVEWGDPPPAWHSRWAAVTEALKARPGEWAKVAEVTPNKRGGSSMGRALEQRGLEVTTRTLVTGRLVGVWARWPEDA